MLVVKHPTLFASLLEHLIDFKLYAIVRNPLSLLLSWQVSTMRIAEGRAPVAERHHPNLKSRLQNCREDATGRMLVLLDFFFSRFAEYLPGRILFYEDIIRTQGKSLILINHNAVNISANLSCRNRGHIDDRRKVELCAARLLADKNNSCWRFYSKSDVEDLLAFR